MRVDSSGTIVQMGVTTIVGPAPAHETASSVTAFLETREDVWASLREDEDERAQSANGTPDEFCHVLVGGGPFRVTLCGQRCRGVVRAHRIGVCPSGYAVCPECSNRIAEEPRI
jgi:hypothetical protein